jgi:hypothetical protein
MNSFRFLTVINLEIFILCHNQQVLYVFLIQWVKLCKLFQLYIENGSDIHYFFIKFLALLTNLQMTKVGHWIVLISFLILSIYFYSSKIIEFSGKKHSDYRNLWVSGLSSITRATDLKHVFSKLGKVNIGKIICWIFLWYVVNILFNYFS